MVLQFKRPSAQTFDRMYLHSRGDVYRQGVFNKAKRCRLHRIKACLYIMLYAAYFRLSISFSGPELLNAIPIYHTFVFLHTGEAWIGFSIIQFSWIARRFQLNCSAYGENSILSEYCNIYSMMNCLRRSRHLVFTVTLSVTVSTLIQAFILNTFAGIFSAYANRLWNEFLIFTECFETYFFK